MRIDVPEKLVAVKAIERDIVNGYCERVYEKRKFVVAGSIFCIFIAQELTESEAEDLLARHTRKILERCER